VLAIVRESFQRLNLKTANEFAIGAIFCEAQLARMIETVKIQLVV